MKALIALLAVCLGAALAYIFSTRTGTRSVPVEEVSTVAETAVVLAQRCQADEGFDPDVAHWSREFEVAPGVRVVIVPHLNSNQHSLGTLARGQVVGKFVNRSNQEYRPLALPPNGQSCLFIKWQPGNSGKDQLSARIIAAGNASMERTVKQFHLDFHPDVHPTPLARWYDSQGRVVTAAGPATTAVEMAFGLASFAAQRDSTGTGGGPSAWVTCVTNGCCRISLLEE